MGRFAFKKRPGGSTDALRGQGIDIVLDTSQDFGSFGADLFVGYSVTEHDPTSEVAAGDKIKDREEHLRRQKEDIKSSQEEVNKKEACTSRGPGRGEPGARPARQERAHAKARL